MLKKRPLDAIFHGDDREDAKTSSRTTCRPGKAIELLEIINYDDIEQELYDRYWDAVSVEATWKSIGERDGEKKGIEIGMKEGLEAGRKEGENNTKIQLARNMLIEGIEPSIVTKITGLTVEEIQNTKRELTRI